MYRHLMSNRTVDMLNAATKALTSDPDGGYATFGCSSSGNDFAREVIHRHSNGQSIPSYAGTFFRIDERRGIPEEQQTIRFVLFALRDSGTVDVLRFTSTVGDVGRHAPTQTTIVTSTPLETFVAEKNLERRAPSQAQPDYPRQCIPAGIGDAPVTPSLHWAQKPTGFLNLQRLTA